MSVCVCVCRSTKAMTAIMEERRKRREMGGAKAIETTPSTFSDPRSGSNPLFPPFFLSLSLLPPFFISALSLSLCI